MSPRLASLGIRPWHESDHDTRCQRCGQLNPVWHTPDLVWADVEAETQARFLCPPCFIRIYEQQCGEEGRLKPRFWNLTPVY